MKKTVAFFIVLMLVLTFSIGVFAENDRKNEADIVASLEITDAKSAVLMEAESGETIFSKGADLELNPASVTKVMTLLEDRGAASIELCCLLDKKEGRKVPYEAKYVGIDIQNEFVIGFGLDYFEYYRNLPYIALVDESLLD